VKLERIRQVVVNELTDIPAAAAQEKDLAVVISISGRKLVHT
jgi:hypothetical protein